MNFMRTMFVFVFLLLSFIFCFFKVALNLPVDIHEKLQLSLSNVVKVRVFICKLSKRWNDNSRPSLLGEAKMAVSLVSKMLSKLSFQSNVQFTGI